MSLRALRHEMVEDQLVWRGINDFFTLRAMRAVPRECFVLPALQHVAYADYDLPIGEGELMNQPYLVALMTQAAQLSPQNRVLEVGTGSGYQAAVLAELVSEVYTVERHDLLAYRAEQSLASASYDGVRVAAGDGSRGWPGADPFDAILVTGSVPVVPQALLAQLAVGGRLIIPVGPPKRQMLARYIKRSSRALMQQDIEPVRFSSLIAPKMAY